MHNYIFGLLFSKWFKSKGGISGYLAVAQINRELQYERVDCYCQGTCIKSSKKNISFYFFIFFIRD